MKKRILFIANVDWYFCLHWLPRVKACIQEGYDVQLACAVTRQANVKIFRALGIKLYSLHLSRASINPIVEWRSFKEIREMVRIAKPDMVHTVTVKANLYGGFAARKEHVPFVNTIAGLGWVFSGRTFSSVFFKFFIILTYRFLHSGSRSGMIFENEDDRNLFVGKKIISEDRGVLIKGAGVDLTKFPVMPAYCMEPDTVLFASRLLEDKGLRLLVGACEQLRNMGQNINLLVAGIFDQNLPDAIQRSQILGWESQKKITWLGERSDMAHLIGRAAVVVLPTLYGEGVPRILIEGAACSRPLIATDVSGCREIIRDGINGILIAGNRATMERDLVNALEEILQSSTKVEEMGANGRIIVENEFSEELVCNSTLKVYQDMMKS